MACYIYVYPETRTPPLYKIGKSNNVVIRYFNLRTGYPDDITESWYIYPKLDKDYSSGMLCIIEKTIHKVFSKFRYRPDREFFQITDINAVLNEIMEHFEKAGMPVGITRNTEDLKDLYDYAEPEEVKNTEEPTRINVIGNFVTHLVNSAPAVTHITSAPLKTPYLLNPYHHQLEILDKLTKWHISNRVAGKLILPPGIGKSYITSFYLRTFPSTTQVLILVPLKSIKEDFELALIQCGVVCKPKVVVYNTARASKYAKKDIVVYDEAHHMCAPENAKLLDLKANKKLFLTATERIINNENALDMSSECFGDYIYQMSILEAIQKGLLCDYKIFLSDWNNGLADMINKFKFMYRKKVIMFFNSVAYAKQICTELVNLKINACVITGDTKMAYRADLISNFANAEFSVICNVGCIAEGVNIPCIDTVVFMEKRESNIGVIQNIGRGLRTYPGKDFCMVVIVEEMLNYKFIENLIVYDERLTNPRQMLISMGLPKNPTRLQGNFDYSIDGIVKMVEVYTSKGLNKVAAFIKRLHNLDIYSMSEYHKKIKEYSEDCPEHPLVDLPGFQWSDLVKCDNPYDLDECTNKVLELYETEKDKLKKISTSIDRLIYLHKLDNRIDIKLLEQLKNNTKISKKLNLLFNLVVGRRVIK
jgi:hypothetical protein